MSDADVLEARNAVIAALNPLLAPFATQAYSADQIQDMGDEPPVRYVEVAVARRFAGSPRRTGSASEVVSYRGTTWAIGVTEDDALRMESAVAKFEGAIVTVDGTDSTTADYVTSSEVKPDNDKFSGWTVWHFSV